MTPTLRRHLVSLPLVAWCAFAPRVARAQGTSPQPHENRIVLAAELLAGGALAFGVHEGGHLLFDVAFDAQPRLKGVTFGPFPFFAVAHRANLSPRREFTISSAGFWTQEATVEWLLTNRPNLRRERTPFAKGMLAFDVLTSIGYAGAAFARTGPFERDTQGIAAAIGVDERAIGALVLAPALLDTYRYFRPNSAWAKWASRIAKVGGVLLIVKER